MIFQSTDNFFYNNINFYRNINMIIYICIQLEKKLKNSNRREVGFLERWL